MICANLYPRYYTLIPCSALLGFFASVLWTGQGTYVTFASQAYSKQRQKDPQSALGFFNGTFFGIVSHSCVAMHSYVSLTLKCALVLACLVVSAHAVLVLDRVVQPITQKGLKGQHPAAAVETDKRALLDKEQESDM
eukprot:TRINITY_DN222_c1_g1_i1.p1 TRINITY_DN222_c1_g1~~TRINITY_DN222_c1_g1_i1.p1  ORF type:complete len:137 (-),score=32.04 TRINITY_DN222_c1_g1_i1:40-450(-)